MIRKASREQLQYEIDDVWRVRLKREREIEELKVYLKKKEKQTEILSNMLNDIKPKFWKKYSRETIMIRNIKQIVNSWVESEK